MAAQNFVSLEKYLSTSYRPDCDYVDGAVLERNVGMFDHSNLMGGMAAYIFFREKEWNVRALISTRVRVAATRIRVPDVCVLKDRSLRDPIVIQPPLVCIEIVSPEDTVYAMQERIDDYLHFGVPYVWLISPSMRRAFVHTNERMYEAKDGILRTENPEIIVPLAEVFELIA